MDATAEAKWDRTHLNIAEEIASHSKCVKYKVGSVITRDTRILSIGYNGTTSGYVNCCDKFKYFDPENEDHRLLHRSWSALYELHAEMNAILFSVKEGISLNGCTLYCTHAPCHNCLKHIVQTGIKRIVYRYDFDAYPPETLEMLNYLNIEIYKEGERKNG